MKTILKSLIDLLAQEWQATSPGTGSAFESVFEEEYRRRNPSFYFASEDEQSDIDLLRFEEVAGLLRDGVLNHVTAAVRRRPSGAHYTTTNEHAQHAIYDFCEAVYAAWKQLQLAYIKICQRRFRRAWQLSAAAQNEGEKRGSGRAHLPICIVDNLRRAFRTITARPPHSLAARVIQRVFVLARYRGPAGSRTNPRPSYGLCGRLIVPCASQRSGKPVCPSHNPLRHNKTQHCHPLSDDHKDIYARALSRPLTVLDRVRREREPGDRPGRRRNVETRRNIAGDRPPVFQIEGGEGDFSSRRYIDLLTCFRGPLSQNPGRLAQKSLVSSAAGAVPILGGQFSENPDLP